MYAWFCNFLGTYCVAEHIKGDMECTAPFFDISSESRGNSEKTVELLKEDAKESKQNKTVGGGLQRLHYRDTFTEIHYKNRKTGDVTEVNIC